jgi:hypothetical protein
VISVRVGGLDPYGLIGKFQALSCKWETAPNEIAKLLIKHPRMIDAYINGLTKCPSYDDGMELSKLLPRLLTSLRWSRSEQGLNLPIGKRPPQPLRRAKLESTKPKRTPEQVHHPHAGDDVIQLVILR